MVYLLRVWAFLIVWVFPLKGRYQEEEKIIPIKGLLVGVFVFSAWLRDCWLKSSCSLHDWGSLAHVTMGKGDSKAQITSVECGMYTFHSMLQSPLTHLPELHWSRVSHPAGKRDTKHPIVYGCDSAVCIHPGYHGCTNSSIGMASTILKIKFVPTLW